MFCNPNPTAYVIYTTKNHPYTLLRSIRSFYARFARMMYRGDFFTLFFTLFLYITSLPFLIYKDGSYYP